MKYLSDMIINNYDIQIESLVVHWVGNKANDDGTILSKSDIKLTEDISSVLLRYFISSIKHEELYRFIHNSDVEMNEVYSYVSKIFEEPKSLYEQSILLVKYLYELSEHPNIKVGEFYVAYFCNCEIDNKNTDAVGIFKSETRDTFLEVHPNNGTFLIESGQGININKLDKGCLIYNIDQEAGYAVSVIDNTNRGRDAKYWIDNFLHVAPRKDEYFNTQNVLSLCKNFIKNELPQHFDMSKADQADFINKSVTFFKEREAFDMSEFANEVIGQKDIIEHFNSFKSDYQKEREIEIADSFSISESAVKKGTRNLRSIIKLDKNFHIYVHGNSNMIEQGVDEKGKFYKVYYQEES